MNALMFYAVIAMAVLLLGAFSLIVGAKATQARNLRKANDDHGYHTTIEDLVKMSAGAVLVFAGTTIAVLAMVLAAPALLTVPATWVAGSFVINVIGATALALVGGFYAGVFLQEHADKVVARKTAHGIMPAVVALGATACSILVSAASAATANMTETMQPVTDILVWAGGDMMPAVLILILAMIPLIMVMIGVRFAGGMLNGLLEGIREIFSFKF